MGDKNQTGSITQTWIWIGLILIMLAVGPISLGFEPQTDFQLFAYGVLTGLIIAYFMVFIYRAGQEYLRKRQ